MKSPLLRALALPVLCWLAFPTARAEEVTISLGMPFDKVIEAIQKCGGQDVEYLPQSTGFNWRLDDYGVQVALEEHYGKLKRLRYSSKEVVRDGKTRPAEIDQSSQSLKFDTEKKTFVAEALPPCATATMVEEKRWRVRLEVLFVSLPLEKALSLLPDLRDESKVDAAYTQIMAAIERKEAKLIDYPVIYTPSGQKATTETIFEKIYPTGIDPSPEGLPAGSPGRLMGGGMEVFEKRNAGITLEVEPVVNVGGEWIELLVEPRHVELDGMEPYEFQKAPGVSSKIEQPRFFTNKESVSVTLRNGQRMLVGVHKSLRTDEVELHILQVTATPFPWSESPPDVLAPMRGGGADKQGP